jgi:hypothetical protein
MFIQNKYTNIYFKIIDRSKSRFLNCYTERHHILPKSMGGGNEPDNITRLTAKEHYLCHRLLPKMTEGVNKMKMAQAAWTMARTRKVKIKSRTYAYLREEASKAASLRQKGIKRKPFTEEHKQKIRKATLKRYQDPNERLKTSIGNTGKKMSEESKIKMSNAKKGKMPKYVPSMKGRKQSEETKIKMKESWVKRRLSKNSNSCLA